MNDRFVTVDLVGPWRSISKDNAYGKKRQLKLLLLKKQCTCDRLQYASHPA